MLDDNVIRSNNVTIELSVRAGLAIGHKNAWPCGTVVTFADHMIGVGGQGYRVVGIHSGDDDRYVKIPFNSVGIINEHKFSLDDYLNRVHVKAGVLDNTIHMWYWVAFTDEFLWVRYDWLKPWTEQKVIDSETRVSVEV